MRPWQHPVGEDGHTIDCDSPMRLGIRRPVVVRRPLSSSIRSRGASRKARQELAMDLTNRMTDDRRRP
jgi:hypothetical protein